MIPAPFEYQRAASVDEAIELLTANGDEAKLLAGGHSLLPLMKLRLALPALLVDIGRLEELSYVRDAGERLVIGGLTRHHDLATDRDHLVCGQVRWDHNRRGRRLHFVLRHHRADIGIEPGRRENEGADSRDERYRHGRSVRSMCDTTPG